jgi:hypothetical protein|tara:strand:- start:528 stop:863 length:336 start_codon:yes stop_codon:yes gene_type:complete
MAIINTYPFKEAPLNKEDEILISDSINRMRTKTTDIEVLSKIITSLGTFVFSQSVASDTWVVKHDLNKYASITIVDSQPVPQTVLGSVTYDNLNQCTVTFSAPFSGKAFCN